MTRKLCAREERQRRGPVWLGLKERVSVQTLPGAAQSVKSPEVQPRSTS